MRREVEQAIREFYDDHIYASPSWNYVGWQTQIMENTKGHVSELEPEKRWRSKQTWIEKKREYIPPLVEEIRNRVSPNNRTENSLEVRENLINP